MAGWTELRKRLLITQRTERGDGGSLYLMVNKNGSSGKKMKFDYTLSLLRNRVNAHPKEYQDEIDLVIKILKEGKGYVVGRGEPGNVKVVWFDSDAVE